MRYAFKLPLRILAPMLMVCLFSGCRATNYVRFSSVSYEDLDDVREIRISKDGGVALMMDRIFLKDKGFGSQWGAFRAEPRKMGTAYVLGTIEELEKIVRSHRQEIVIANSETESNGLLVCIHSLPVKTIPDDERGAIRRNPQPSNLPKIRHQYVKISSQADLADWKVKDGFWRWSYVEEDDLPEPLRDTERIDRLGKVITVTVDGKEVDVSFAHLRMVERKAYTNWWWIPLYAPAIAFDLVTWPFFAEDCWELFMPRFGGPIIEPNEETSVSEAGRVNLLPLPSHFASKLKPLSEN